MPADPPPLVPGAGPRPFRTRDDVLAQIDDLLEPDPTAAAPIRDALVDALTALLLELEYRAEYALAECDPLRATLERLTAIGGDDRTIPRAPDEADEPYRARLLATPGTVTETAIVLGVNLILAPFTITQCRLFDGALDRWFVGKGGVPLVSWRSFIGASPEYPDRLYSGQEALNGGVSRPNSDPGGARVFSQTLGRQFVLLLPDLGALTVPTPLSGFYVGKSTPVSAGQPPLAAIVSPNFDAPLSIYRSIEGFVNSVAGQSIRWGFLAELEAA